MLISHIGLDPRDKPEAYLRRHWELQDGDISDGLSLDLKVLLGDRYEEGRAQTLIKQLEDSSDIEEFIKQVIIVPFDNESQGQPRPSVGPQSSPLVHPAPENPPNNGDNNNGDNRVPERAKHILRDFCQRGGSERPQALEQLIEIFGPGSESLSGKLLDLLASDSSSDGWDAAICEANFDLNELQRDAPGPEGIQKGKGSLSTCLFVSDPFSLIVSEKAPCPPEDIPMDIGGGTDMANPDEGPGPAAGISTGVRGGGEHQQQQTDAATRALQAYLAQSSQLLS